MLTPTHIQVAVLHTKDLVVKGKNGTNDAFIIFSLGKEKFQSSLKEKASESILEWNEGCDLVIPSSKGNKAELCLKVLHKASMGDKFLGRVSLPLSDFDVMAKPKAVWYPLKPRAGNEKDTKYRGEIELKIKFLIKQSTLTAESAHDLAGKSKRKDSFRSSLGSILSLGKRKKKKDKSGSGSSKETINSSTDSLKHSNISSSRLSLNNNMPIINDDPGVISEEDETYSPKPDIRAKKQIMQSGLSINSGSTSGNLNSTSLPATPRHSHKASLGEIFSKIPEPLSSATQAPPEVKIEYDPDDNDPELQAHSSTKPRIVRLPSVIVEEPTGDLKISSSVPTKSSTLPMSSSAPYSPPKLTVSSSMINLTDGKGSLRKTFKSMFSSSKHLSVDEIFQTDGAADGSTRSRSSSNQSEQHQLSTLTAGFTMKRKSSSIRDLKIPKETFKLYERKSKEELVAMIINLQETAESQKLKINDLEDYIDKLLLRVLDNMPSLLKKGNSVRE